jgi:hypothetical protein
VQNRKIWTPDTQSADAAVDSKYSAFGGLSAAQCPEKESLSVIGHGALLLTVSGILVAAHAKWHGEDWRKIEQLGKRDAHRPLPKHPHAVRPLDRHITRSLTPVRQEPLAR